MILFVPIMGRRKYYMRWKPGIGVLFFLFLGCAKSFDGPTPDPMSVSPSRGWTGADVRLVITGTGFSPMVKNTLSGNESVVLPEVYLESIPETALTVVFSSTTEIHAVVSAGAPVGGPYDLKVINPNGKYGILPSAYTVTENPLITVSSIYPNFGWTGAETLVTISGNGFKSTPSAYLETESGNPSYLENVSFISSTSLSAIVPSGLPVGGPYKLVVINPDGDAGVLENAFTITLNPLLRLTL